jgi:hypothetical protein
MQSAENQLHGEILRQQRIHTTFEGEMKLVVHVDTQSNLTALLAETIIEGTAFLRPILVQEFMD